MSRLRLADILCELVELGQERVQEVRQQLVYYRASVYKQETANLIDGRIDSLRLLSDLTSDDTLAESFRDYDAMRAEGAMAAAPGECSFSKRVTVLLAEVGDRLLEMHAECTTRSATPEGEATFADNVRKYRHQLLALCRHGSRHWTFFQSL